MKRLLLVLSLISCFLAVEARHLIGGEITYRCLGSSAGGVKYKFTMRIYRDCACSNCAEFDPNAAISIYRCPKGGCENLTTFNTFEAFRVPVLSIQPVAPPTFPCLEVPPNICVEEAVYEWERTLPLYSYSWLRAPIKDTV